MDRVAATGRRGRLGRSAAIVSLMLPTLVMLPPRRVVAQRTTSQVDARTSNPKAAALFRSAAALEKRELFDLAAGEWAELVEQFPQDALVGKARYYRGVCLVRLNRYAEAEAEFQIAVAARPPLGDALLERAYANLGLAQYRRAAEAKDDERNQAFDAAIAALGEQLERFPDGRFAAQAHFYRAEACSMRGDSAASIADYQAVVARDSNHPLRAAALFGLGIAQQELDRPNEALHAFDRLLKEFPTHPFAPEAHFYRGVWRAKSGNVSGAITDLERLSESWPESPVAPEALLALAKLEKQQGNLSAAQVSLGRFLVNYREHRSAPQVRLLRASVRHEMGQYADALADAEGFLEAMEGDAIARADATLIRGMCEVKLHRAADAVRTLEALVERGNQYRAMDRALYELAWAYDQNGRPERAIATFRRLASEHPGSALVGDCWLRVGESQFAAGEFDAAAASFAAMRRCARDRPLREQAAYKLGWARFSLEQFEGAEQAFKEQLRDCPQGELAADAGLMIAECKFARRDYAGASTDYAAALSDAAASEELVELGLLHAAQAASQLNDWDQCAAWIDRLERDFAASEHLPQARFERGVAQYRLKQFDAAAGAFASLDSCGDKVLAARARFMIGEIHFARKEFDSAVRQFFQVAYGYGDGEVPEGVRHWQAESLFEAARCLEQTERIDSAQKLYRELTEHFPESDKARHARLAIDQRNTNKR